MRECPKCGELNGENNSECYKCGTKINHNLSSKKKCPKCGSIFKGNKDICEYCGEYLVTYDDRYYLDQYYNKSYTDSNTWMYVCTVLIPLIGIILGCVKISNDKRDDLGKTLIILGVVLTLVYSFLGLLWI